MTGGPLTRCRTVALIDDHEMTLAGLGATIAKHPDEFDVVALSRSVEEHLAGPGRNAEIVILDLYLDHDEFIGSRVPELIEQGSIVIAHTSEERPYPLRYVVSLGVVGLILKRDPGAKVVEVLRTAATGNFACSGPLANALLTDKKAMAKLTDQERAVLDALSLGVTRAKAAKHLNIAQATVSEYLTRVRDAFREIGIEAGNTKGLIRLADAEGQLGGAPGSMSGTIHPPPTIADPSDHEPTTAEPTTKEKP